MIHVFIGTKAQYIKTAPVLRALDAAGVAYRLIDSGQHAQLTQALRAELGVRAPDYALRQGANISDIAGGVRWLWHHLWRAWVAPSRVRDEVFGGHGGLCLIHGDTVSTLLAAYLARRAGLRVAHLEAGLYSGSLWDPFPEEMVRRIATRWSDLLFAPSAWAAEHLRRIGARGTIVTLPINTGAEAAAYALPHGRHPLPALRGYVLVTIHRLETICRRARLVFLVETIRRAATTRPILFVMHEPTRLALAKAGLLDSLRQMPQVQVIDLQPYADFLQTAAGADGVITDGGSIQEECAYLGVPCLVLRDHTERPEGIGENVTLAPFDAAAVDRFLADPSSWRRPSRLGTAQPSRVVVETLQHWTETPALPPPRVRWWGWLISLGLLAWLARLIMREASRVSLWPGPAAWPAWTVAVCVQVIATCWAAWCWTRLARAVGVPVAPRRLMRIWTQSLLAKYLPGGLWQMASRWYLLQGAGASSSTALVAMLLEHLCVAISALVVLLAAWSTPVIVPRLVPAFVPWLWAVIAAVVVTVPVWLPRGLRWIGRRAGLALDLQALSPRRLIRLAAAYVLYWMISLIALCWLVRGWSGITWSTALAIALTYVAAFLIGFVCPWAPAGLGVREGVFAWGMAPLVGAGVAAAIAISSRVWFMSTDAISSTGLHWLTRENGTGSPFLGGFGKKRTGTITARWDLGAALALSAAVFIVYAGSLTSPFVFDDLHTVVHNAYIKNLHQAGRFFTSSAMTSVQGAGSMFRPLVMLSYALNYAFGGLNPIGYHLFNLWLHLLNALLLYFFMTRALDQPRWLATLASLLFAVHPLNSQAVIHIAARSSLLATTWVLLGCVAYFRRTGGANRTAWWTAVAYGGGLLSKEIAVILPALLIWIAWARTGTPDWRGSLRRLWPCGVLLVAYLAWRHHLYGAITTATPVRPWGLNLGLSCRAVFLYIRLWLAPLDLCLSRALPIPTAYAEMRWWLPVFGYAALWAAALICAFVKRVPGVALALGWFLIVLVPSHPLASFHLPAAEHHSYLANLGWCLLLGTLGQTRRTSGWYPRGLAIVGSVLCVVWGALTIERTLVWQNRLRFWTAAAHCAPQTAGVWISLAQEYEARGDEARARTLYRQALLVARAPIEEAQVRTNLGRLQWMAHRLPEAQRELARALALDSTSAEAWNNLGLVHEDRGRLDAARHAYAMALTLAPGLPDPWQNLGVLALREGRWPEAAARFRAAIAADPDRLSAHIGLGEALEGLGQDAQAAVVYRWLRTRAPDDAGLTRRLHRVLQRLQHASQATP